MASACSWLCLLTIGFGSLSLAAAETPAEVLAAQEARVQVLERICPAVTAIFTSTAADNGGSGVVISPDGFALTNFHVAQPCGVSMKCGLSDGKLYDAVLVGLDPTGDVALIKLLDRSDFPYVELGDSETARAGDEVYVIGNPFLLAMDFKPTVTFGLLSGTGRYQYPAGTLLEYADCLQTDASINPGNSGGPLFNAQGKLIGINGRGSFEKRGRVNVGVGYAISINQIKHFLGDLKSGRIVDHGQIGVRVINDSRGRANIADILDDTDAYRRGLRHEDQIVQVAHRTIRTSNEFTNVLATFPSGWRVPIAYSRDGKRFETAVRISNLHRPGELAAVMETPVAPPSPREKEQPEKPMPEGPEKPKGPQDELPPQGLPTKAEKSEIPDVVKAVYAARPGFANYYFNRIAQDRLDQERKRWATPEEPNAQWTLTGKSSSRGSFTLRIGDRFGRYGLDAGESVVEFNDDNTPLLDPPKSGGLIVAAAVLRRYITQGGAGMEEAVYWGQAPLIGKSGLYDVLALRQWLTESRLYFDPKSGELRCVEMYPDDLSDPCELWLSDYQPLDGDKTFPRKIEVVHGDAVYDVLSIESIVWGNPEDKPLGENLPAGNPPMEDTLPAAGESTSGGQL